MSRIFISHSHRDNARAVEVRDWLCANGWDDVFLDLDPAAGIAPGEQWQSALKAAADRCEAVLFLISPHWLASAWCLSEFLLAKQLGKRLFPLLIDGASIEGLPAEIASDHQAVDLTNDPQAWARLKEGLRRAGLDATGFPFPPGRRPYPGFEPLTEDDAAIFFGREAQVLRGLDRLRLMRDAGAERMLVVLGASGAGKSSYLRAGLWPRLRRDDRNFWPLPTIRPERAVLTGKSGLYAALEKALADPRLAGRPEVAELPRARGSLATLVESAGLAQLLGTIRRAAAIPLGAMPTPSSPQAPSAPGAGPALVLLIDQAEELLSDESRGEAERFLKLLVDALEAEKSLIIVLAIRSDAFPAFQAKPGLAAVAREPFDLAPMPEGSLRLVIEGPAKFATPPLKIEPALVDTLLGDSTGQDALPLLAFTLDRLSRDYGAEGSLTLSQYVSSGGVRGVITAAVEEALAEGRRRGTAPADDKALEALLRAAFVPHLARVNEAGQFVRRIAYTQEIPQAARPLIDLLVEARLLIRDRDERGETVEVAHEALLREWALLRDFLEADREFLVGKRQIADDVQIWQSAPAAKKREALLTGLRLNRAQHWLTERSQADLTDAERAFIGDSIKAAEAARRRRAGLAAAAIVLLTAFSAAAAYEWVNASREARVAEANAEQAKLSAAAAERAQSQAETNARTAKTNEARARGAQAKAESQESALLANQSLLQAASGDILGAIRTALAALPSDAAHPDRPYVPQAAYALAKAMAGNRLQAAIKPSSDYVNVAAFSHDGDRFALGTRDGWFKIYETATQRLIFGADERRQAVLGLAYSGDGSRIVTAYQDPPSLILRDARSGAALRTARLTETPGKVLLTRDGGKAIVIRQGFDVRPVVIDFDDAAAPSRVLGFPPTIGSPNLFDQFIKSIALSPDEHSLMLVGPRGVFVWDLASGGLIATSMEPAPGDPDTLAHVNFPKIGDQDEEIAGGAFLKSGDAVLIGKQRVYVVDPKAAAIKVTHDYADSWQVSADKTPLLNPANDRIVFAGSSRTLLTYALKDWRLVASRKLPSDIGRLALSPDGKMIAASGNDLVVRTWQIDSTAQEGVFLGHAGRVSGVAFSSQGSRMITYGDDTARLWDLRDMNARFDAVPPGWHNMRADARTSLVALQSTAGPDWSAAWGLWDFSKRAFIGSKAVQDLLGDGCRPGPFSPSGKLVTLRCTYSPTDAPQRRLASVGHLRTAAEEAGQVLPPVPDSEPVGVIAVVNAASGTVLHLLAVVGAGQLLDKTGFVSDDGRLLGVFGSHNSDDTKGTTTDVQIWNLEQQRKQLTFTERGGDAQVIYGAATGSIIVTTAYARQWSDVATSVWSLESGALVARFPAPLQRFVLDPGAADALLGADRLVMGDDSHKPVLAAVSTGKEIGSVAGKAMGASKVAISLDRRRLLLDSVNAPRTLWNLDSAAPVEMTESEFDWSVAAFSDDGSRVITRGERKRSGAIDVFESDSGKRLATFANLPSIRDSYAGNTGRRVAVQTDPRTVEILAVGGSESPAVIRLDRNMRRWRFVASDRRFVTADEAGTVQVWDPDTGRQLYRLAGADPVEPLGGADGSGPLVPILQADGGAIVLDAVADRIVWHLPPDQKASRLQLAPDGKSIGVVEPDRLVVFALDRGNTIASLPIRRGDDAFFSYNDAGDRVALYIRGPGNGLWLVDISGGKQLSEAKNVGMYALATDTLAFAAGQKLSLLNARTGAPIREVSFARPIQSIELDRAGNSVAVVTTDFRVWTVPVQTGEPRPLVGLSENPLWLRFAAGGSKLLVYQKSGQTSLYDTANARVLTRFAVDWAAKTASLSRWVVRADPSGALVAVRGPNNVVGVYRTRDGAQQSEINWSSKTIVDMAFSADGSRLVLASEDGHLASWDVARNRSAPALALSRKYSLYDPVTIKRTPDPSRMLAIDSDGRVDLLSLNTNTVRTFYGGEPQNRVNAALSPDGSLLAVIGSSNVLRLWDVATAQVLEEVPRIENTYPMTDLRFSPDGGLLAVTGGLDESWLLRMPKVGDGLIAEARELIAHGAAPRSDAPQLAAKYRLGIFMKDLSAEVARRIGLSTSQGAEVIEVLSDSAAQSAGLRVGDVIVKINGRTVAGSSDASAQIKNAHLDLALGVLRNGSAVSLEAALGD